MLAERYSFPSHENPALNLLGYVAQSMYRHGQNHVMESGEKGLSEYCLRLASSEGAPSG